MRVLTVGAVLMATAAFGAGATPSAEAASGVQPERAAGFTPPIGTDKGSLRGAERPAGFEMDLEWILP